MKHLLIICFLGSLSLWAAEEKGLPTKFIFGADITNGGLSLGLRSDNYLPDMFILGIGLHGRIFHANKPFNPVDPVPELGVHYYGAIGLGYRFFPDSFIYFTNYNSFGLGGIEHAGRGIAFSVEPELNLEVDYLSIMRLGAGLSYRFMFTSLSVPNSAFNGLSAHFFIEASL